MPLHVRMTPRDVEEEHRASTPLELFFDLTFVVAVAQASEASITRARRGHARTRSFAFPLVFFAIWWAWMNFTWFASAYDTDDVPYRIAVFVLMTGVLILAGRRATRVRRHRLRRHHVGLRGHAARDGHAVAARRVQHPEGRPVRSGTPCGHPVLQVGWVARLALPNRRGWSRSSCSPPRAVRPALGRAGGSHAWHPGHIAERYGLFTIIVLGESVLSATVGCADGDRPRQQVQ